MDNTPTTEQPQQSYTKQTIEALLGIYLEAKEGFFTTATKDDAYSLQMAPQYYNQLLQVMHSLLELSKADNRNIIGDIITIQKRIEEYDNLKHVSNDVICELRDLCGYIDTELLFPYLTTIKPQINI